ncbi:hypothetical protein BMF81_02735 [Nodularia spumigena UHCC 0039]|uniref:Uncharacterized protein n=1 Tax=Nodularia spumigena UHCC 0039 TaxID=1914872 RepID=A0A2S0Q8V4_NODSP|nr:hypothetical protein [Nodularia spumigena]AVZ30782.1 hypothetical protein BMF81_02735 [Nodularia spumigena UHCC 0039]
MINIELLEWSEEELECGKIIKIKGFPAQKKVKLFAPSFNNFVRIVSTVAFLSAEGGL